MATSPTTKKGKGKKAPPTKPQRDQQMAKATERAFQNYIRYLSRLQPSTYAGSMREARKLFPPGQLGPMYTPKQLRGQAQAALKGIFDPRIKSIRDTYQRQAQLGAKNITGFTGTYMNRLGQIGPQLLANNQQAMNQQAAVGGALADYMRNTGAQLTGDLTARLEGANLSPGQIEGTVGNAADTGFLGSGALAASNAASLMRMGAEGNAWANWGAGLPGIAALQGQMELGKFQGQLADAFTSQMGDLQSEMAQAGLSIYQDLLDRDLERRNMGLNRSQAMASFLGDSRQRGLNAALGGASLMQNWANMLLDRELGFAGLASDDYATAASFYDAQNPVATPQPPAPPPTPADMAAQRRELFDYVYGAFANSPLRNRSNLRPKVMAMLRQMSQGMGLNERQLTQMREQIITAIIGQRPKPTQKPTAPNDGDPRADPPGEVDLGYDPWITVPGFMFDFPFGLFGG